MAEDEIIFLGTGGARVVVATQLRATGGILFYLDGKLILVDPGPGSLIRFLQYGRPHRISRLRVFIITHRHIDHSSDINVMIDGLTEGGKKKRGILFGPADALNQDPVVLKFYQGLLEKIIIIEEGASCQLDNLKIGFPISHQHGVETYGITFHLPDYSIGYITDTKYFPSISNYYKNDILIINVLRPEPIEYDHLYVPDVEKILNRTRPALAIITHFGMMMLKKNPFKIAAELSKKSRVKVIAAKDGMRIKPSEQLNG